MKDPKRNVFAGRVREESPMGRRGAKRHVVKVLSSKIARKAARIKKGRKELVPGSHQQRTGSVIEKKESEKDRLRITTFRPFHLPADLKIFGPSN